MKKIGFIGIGVMGKSMAANLMKNGYEVAVYSRTKSKADALVNDGAVWCDTVAECAKGRDAVITMVGYPQDVEQVYFGADGILENADAGTYIIDMTTTSPQLSVKIYEQAVSKKLHALDAPVSGGDIGAANATLSIMVGGDKDDFDACLKLFEAMGKNIIHEGGAGAGQHTKMANQIAIAGTVAGVCEAVAYAEKTGLDPQLMLKSISAGAAGSWQMNNNGPKMIAGDYAPGFFIKHFIKDMRIAVEEAEAAGIKLGVLNEVLEMYKSLEKGGFGDLGTQAIVEYYRDDEDDGTEPELPDVE
ncbi:MAG: NAD(P)-dependent oxidoreductase [Oscillospiraceae bacterium]|nr:NAD(P)-dependent oxidoreductase [Oscillospiraceae bacterium]